ncbi:MAG: 50S ribosomal protein L23 [Candidatus Doudnabacteria bacterium]
MALLDRFKSKQGSKKAPKEDNVLDLVKEPVAGKTDSTPTVLKENTGRAHHILHRYHLSEKTNQFSSIGRYVFKVAKTANKIEVKKAVEAVYDVHVSAVNMINVSGKNRRQGKSVGRTQDWKKAIVTLKSGERIAGLSEGV